MFSRPARGRCLNKHGRAGPFLPVTKPTPSGLKGRGALGEPGRSRRPAPRARESDALPVTHAEREPAAPSGSRRRAPTTAKGPAVPRPARAAAPREDTAGSSATEERGSKDAMRLSSLREIEDFPLAVRTLRVLTTSRESSALSNDSESRAARRLRRLEPCERAVRGGFTASNSRRGAPRMAREQTSSAPRAFCVFRLSTISF